MVTAVLSAHRGSVEIFYRKAEYFAIEELCLHGPNVISFQLVTGKWRCHVVESYIDPSNALTIDEVDAAIRDQTYGAEILVAGNINANQTDPEGTPRAEAIADNLAAARLMDMGLHFTPRRKLWLKDRCTWCMQQDRR